MTMNERYHDFSAGHRVYGHENKCAFLHGHNYRVHFVCRGTTLDGVGRVIDFNERLCQWLENNWDHKMLLWQEDPMYHLLRSVRSLVYDDSAYGFAKRDAVNSLVELPFNPTAENMAKYLLHEIGPRQLSGTGIILARVIVEETRKCSAIEEI
jgi:6-pyruvoyltetrahydropterin/6-carboxytetrahydropterin synthase